MHPNPILNEAPSPIIDATIQPGENEMIERTALASLHEVADGDMRASLGLSFTGIAGATVSRASGLPASAIVVNRAFAPSLPDLQSVAAIAAHYKSAGVERFFLHGPGDGSSVDDLAGAALAAALVRVRDWQKFTRPRGAPLPEVAGHEIIPVDPVRAPQAARAAAAIVCAAFDLGEAAEPWLARLGHDRRWRVFLALVDGKPAGTGALFVENGIGWSDWGATDPAFRGRGVQRAVLAHRLRIADELGLARVHTCTGAAVPGDPQHSYRNILRCGFRETRLRANFAPR